MVELVLEPVTTQTQSRHSDRLSLELDHIVKHVSTLRNTEVDNFSIPVFYQFKLQINICIILFYFEIQMFNQETEVFCKDQKIITVFVLISSN